MAYVDLRTKYGSICFVSVYLRPFLPDVSSVFLSALSSLSSPHTIFEVDGNAKHSIWISIHLDRQGPELESLLVTYRANITILNALRWISFGVTLSLSMSL